MTKRDFLGGLRTALSFKVSAANVEENIRYYDEYISSQVRMGRKENEVVEELGDPRLLARSIADASKGAEQHDAYHETYQEESKTEYHNEKFGKAFGRKLLRMPGWFIGIISIVVIFFIIYVVISFLSFLAPILIPVIVILAIIRLFHKE